MTNRHLRYPVYVKLLPGKKTLNYYRKDHLEKPLKDEKQNGGMLVKIELELTFPLTVTKTGICARSV
jgi:hypothetical protein